MSDIIIIIIIIIIIVLLHDQLRLIYTGEVKWRSSYVKHRRAQNPLHSPPPCNFPVDGEVANLLRT